MIERNVMRYFLAVDAYLGPLSAPPETGRRKRLEDWFVAAERYPAQLHEVTRAEYFAMREREYGRLHAALWARALSRGPRTASWSP